MTHAVAMPAQDLVHLIDLADEEHLEREADRVFAPFAGKVSDKVMALMRDAFVIVAATDPVAVRARKRAREGGPVARSGEQVKEADGEGAAGRERKSR